MKTVKDSIIGHKISNIRYSEVNDKVGVFYFDGFHVFDHGINITMENGYQWHINWSDEEFFELGSGEFLVNKHLSSEIVKIWDATDQWRLLLDFPIKQVEFTYVDEHNLIFASCCLTFANDQKVVISIGPEMATDQNLPTPFEYDFGGEIYVFFDEKLISRAVV
jgi:hypothetical protein